MAIREDVVQSAVTFLSDPSVANAPIDKRIAFLQSKNLTQEEIDASLARAGEGGSAQAAPQGNYGYQQQQVMRQSQQPYGYAPYQGAWQQPPPPEIPRRDWRDYFIMATVMSGLGWGAYVVAKRYIVPLIKPPTPPQLEQDKASIDESFSRAFELIEQLSKDTESIKSSEEARKERLDSALSEMETAIQELKSASRRRDDDTRRIGDEVRSLQGAIPKAMKSAEENTDTRMRELNSELKSLKTLISNRVSGASPAPAPRSATPTNGSTYNPPSVNGSGTSTPAPTSSNTEAAATAAPQKPATPTFSKYGAGKGGIPSWQMAAAAKKEEEKDTAASGTVADVTTE